MAHAQQREFLQKVVELFPKNFTGVKVLEVGSLNINGTVRDFFTDCNYIGIDVGAGIGVDIVMSGHDYFGPDNSFDTIISCECFEHNPHWHATFRNMYRMTKPAGLIVMTCATDGRPEHGTTRTSPHESPLTISKGWDYYRNLNVSDFTDLMDIQSMFSEHIFITDHRHHDLYFWGVKK